MKKIIRRPSKLCWSLDEALEKISIISYLNLLKTSETGYDILYLLFLDLFTNIVPYRRCLLFSYAGASFREGRGGLRTPPRIYDFSFFSVNCTFD